MRRVAVTAFGPPVWFAARRLLVARLGVRLPAAGRPVPRRQSVGDGGFGRHTVAVVVAASLPR